MDPTRIQSDCSGKAKHSPTRARQIARDMRRRHGEKAIQAYACKFCVGWHVGSTTAMPDKRKQGKNERRSGQYGDEA